MFVWANKAEKNKLNQVTNEILNLQGKKKELEIQMEQQSLELANIKAKEKMRIEEEQHKHRLVIDTKNAEHDRDKKNWEEDRNQQIKRMTVDFELKLQEAVTLAKLDSEQKVKQAELDKSRSISELDSKHATALSVMQQDLSAKYYDKLSASLADLHQNGDKNTKFIQELALKMFDKAPTFLPSEPNVHVTGAIADMRRTD